MRKEADDALVLEESDLCRIPARQRKSNKGTYGPLLCIAGSEGMAGAAYLTALGGLTPLVSISNTKTHAMAVAVLERGDRGGTK